MYALDAMANVSSGGLTYEDLFEHLQFLEAEENKFTLTDCSTSEGLARLGTRFTFNVDPSQHQMSKHTLCDDCIPRFPNDALNTLCR